MLIQELFGITKSLAIKLQCKYFAMLDWHLNLLTCGLSEATLDHQFTFIGASIQAVSYYWVVIFGAWDRAKINPESSTIPQAGKPQRRESDNIFWKPAHRSQGVILILELLLERLLCLRLLCLSQVILEWAPMLIQELFGITKSLAIKLQM